MANSDTIAIIILNYNSYQESIDLVAQLQKQSVAERLRIVIVDNNSPNNSYEKLEPLQQLYPNVTLLQTGENLGYARGNNYGLRYLERNYPPQYVAILNNDIILHDDCFERLAERYEVLDRPAFIAPLQKDIHGRDMFLRDITSYGEDLLRMFILFRAFASLRKIKPIDTTGHCAMEREVTPGSLLFISFERFREIGYFYPNTFLFYEEYFIAAQATQAGYKSYTLLDKSYIHNHSTTINRVFNYVAQCRMRYDCLIEFTKVHRPHGAIKARILSMIANWSLIEISAVATIKSILRDNRHGQRL